MHFLQGIYTGIEKYLLPPQLEEKSISGKYLTSWPSQAARARSRHVQVDSDFNLDDGRPSSGRCKPIITFHVSQIHMLLIVGYFITVRICCGWADAQRKRKVLSGRYIATKNGLQFFNHAGKDTTLEPSYRCKDTSRAPR